MFHFFQKKIFLADYLHGLVDIHNHILPGIDDGAKTVNKSVELLRGFSDLGVTEFICTPHIMHNYYNNTEETILSAHTMLKEHLSKVDSLEVSLDFAAEHMIDDNFEHLLSTKKVLPIKGEYLLIEMSYLQPSINFDVSIEKITKERLFPVLAHPERYLYLKPKKDEYIRYKQKGVHFQLNLLSLGGHYGVDVQKIAHSLLDSGMYEYVGSDVHKMHHIEALKSVKLNERLLNKVLPVLENTKSTFGS
ncbi:MULTISPECIES: tyrosine-protein phosphatase [Flavobacteriaceae]|uniref:tyrosine-protein phosphatase n=1 Tax=Flavobacteriaceae TaxID=49546 RepID=UPI002349D7AC|nr:CpsB/CapC family capsule biosynthesis tyrosine phosphatase [Muricauda sp. SP22]MDC6364408.1 histidinol phosphatase [Muricauda sp. SP22]